MVKTSYLGCGAGALALLVAALFRVWVHQSIVEHGYAISDARRRARELHEEHKTLEVEYSALRSPDRLERDATGLGLTPMTPEQLHVVQVEIRP